MMIEATGFKALQQRAPQAPTAPDGDCTTGEGSVGKRRRERRTCEGREVGDFNEILHCSEKEEGKGDMRGKRSRCS